MPAVQRGSSVLVIGGHTGVGYSLVRENTSMGETYRPTKRSSGLMAGDGRIYCQLGADKAPPSAYPRCRIRHGSTEVLSSSGVTGAYKGSTGVANEYYLDLSKVCIYQLRYGVYTEVHHVDGLVLFILGDLGGPGETEARQHAFLRIRSDAPQHVFLPELRGLTGRPTITPGDTYEFCFDTQGRTTVTRYAGRGLPTWAQDSFGYLREKEIGLLRAGSGCTLSACSVHSEGTTGHHIVNSSCLWSSSDEGVATVSPNGYVQAVAGSEGTATITCSQGVRSQTCLVRVAEYGMSPENHKTLLIPGGSPRKRCSNTLVLSKDAPGWAVTHRADFGSALVDLRVRSDTPSPFYVSYGDLSVPSIYAEFSLYRGYLSVIEDTVYASGRRSVHCKKFPLPAHITNVDGPVRVSYDISRSDFGEVYVNESLLLMESEEDLSQRHSVSTYYFDMEPWRVLKESIIVGSPGVLKVLSVGATSTYVQEYTVLRRTGNYGVSMGDEIRVAGYTSDVNRWLLQEEVSMPEGAIFSTYEPDTEDTYLLERAISVLSADGQDGLGGSYQLHLMSSTGDDISDKATWSSDDTSAVTVSATGKVSCVHNGATPVTVTITAEYKGYSHYCVVGAHSVGPGAALTDLPGGAGVRYALRGHMPAFRSSRVRYQHKDRVECNKEALFRSIPSAGSTGGSCGLYLHRGPFTGYKGGISSGTDTAAHYIGGIKVDYVGYRVQPFSSARGVGGLLTVRRPIPGYTGTSDAYQGVYTYYTGTPYYQYNAHLGYDKDSVYAEEPFAHDIAIVGERLCKDGYWYEPGVLPDTFSIYDCYWVDSKGVTGTFQLECRTSSGGVHVYDSMLYSSAEESPGDEGVLEVDTTGAKRISLLSLSSKELSLDDLLDSSKTELFYIPQCYVALRSPAVKGRYTISVTNRGTLGREYDLRSANMVSGDLLGVSLNRLYTRASA